MILLFFKSIIIGIANIIPGVSGGTLAVMLNVYDPITEKIGNFFLVDRKTKVCGPFPFTKTLMSWPLTDTICPIGLREAFSLCKANLW